jgi:SRSO17 transposase
MAQRLKKGDAYGSKHGSRLATVARRFLSFMNSYAAHFWVYNHDQSQNAFNYLKGLTQSNLEKNMERMVEADSKANYGSLQQFITDSSWSAYEVMDHVAQDANTLIGDVKGSGLIIDESGDVKKGQNSVGVARQWIGNIGKVENGQVGVYACLVNGKNYSLVNARLYLPEEWTSDKNRLDKAKVPEAERGFKTKEDIAYEMVLHARRLKLSYSWIGADGGYGKGLDFPLKLEALGETFVIDVHKDQLIYLEEPQLEIPAYAGRGRKPEKSRPIQKPFRVDNFALAQPEEAWQKIAVREGAKGMVEYEFIFARVWIYSQEHRAVRQWHLIIRRDIETKSDVKYTFSNALADTAKQRLTYMQGQRYWVERSFEEGKQNCGMADYQHRRWLSWYHHMALVMMALLFMMMEKIENRDETPLLTGRDISELLTFYLQKPPTEEEVFRRIEIRHQKRRRDMKNAANRKRSPSGY